MRALLLPYYAPLVPVGIHLLRLVERQPSLPHNGLDRLSHHIAFRNIKHKAVQFDRAAEAIRDEIRLLLKEGLTPAELEKGREQLKTALVLGQEKTSVTMMAQGRHALMTGELYDIDARLAELDRVTVEDAREAAETMFRLHRAAVSVVGRDPADISSVIRG